MNVSFTRDTLSWSVGKALSQDIIGAAGTAEFVLLFDKYVYRLRYRINITFCWLELHNELNTSYKD